ncbi:MAG: hypothetical protein RIT45_2221 [Pseudomonadota bacterium]|jgi:hypothetical protein
MRVGNRIGLRLFGSVALTVALCATGCGSDGDGGTAGGGDEDAVSEPTPPEEPLAIVGVWRSNFGSVETIAGERWHVHSEGMADSLSPIVTWDNAARWLVTQNAKDAEFGPGTFNRIDWDTVNAHEIAVCTVDFGLASGAAAVASTKTADKSDLDGKGCGGFPWTRLRRTDAIGLFESAFGGNERLDAERMGWAATISWDNGKRRAVTRNLPDDAYSPNTYNVVFWQPAAGGAFHYCTADFGLATAELAEDSTKTADGSAPETSGCGGFGWTKLSPLPIRGTWKNQFGGIEQIDGLAWGPARLHAFSASARTAILRSHADDPYTPGQFARVRWTVPDAKGFHYCFEVFGKKTAEEAQNDATTADAGDLDGKGCGGFPWTHLEAVPF